MLQADQYREWLARERAELVAKISKYEQRLEQCLVSSDLRKLSHLRGCIRHIGNEIRAIDRMVLALESRFSESAATLRRA